MPVERAPEVGRCPGACGTHGPRDRPAPVVGAEQDAAPSAADPVLAFADGAALAAFGGHLVRLASLRETAVRPA